MPGDDFEDARSLAEGFIGDYESFRISIKPR